MVDATGQPDLEKMTIEEAKQYLLDWARTPQQGGGWNYDITLNDVSTVLLDAAARRKEAQRILQQGSGLHGRVMHLGGEPEGGQHTRVLYDAVWELVREGLLRLVLDFIKGRIIAKMALR